MSIKGTRVLILLLLLLAVVAAGAADDHRYGGWVVKRKATCTQEGHEFRYCQDCDHWEQRTTNKLPHQPDQWVVTKEPTCTEQGVETATCTVCGGFLRHTLDKLGHDWVAAPDAKKQPTCNSTGSGNMICQRCGRTKTGTIPKLEHEWTEWAVTKEPSGKKKGTRERSCVLCGKTQSEKFYYEGTLYEGMSSNPDVIRLQIMLRDLGYYGGKISSGSFGSITGEAVAKFQKKHGLPANQVADPETMRVLEEEWEAMTGRDASQLTADDI